LHASGVANAPQRFVNGTSRSAGPPTLPSERHSFRRIPAKYPIEKLRTPVEHLRLSIAHKAVLILKLKGASERPGSNDVFITSHGDTYKFHINEEAAEKLKA
jgi:hypothetical protein